ncbi:MAG: hypothetical protein NC299_14880 [Lachnospiraceae bacterium]|nr:hypothetical protein [Ruminococcus sp.]MCM1276621.1 hypothetical protein [Lachnospiraceae bacterium]
MRENLKQILSVARTEYIGWLCSPRNIIVGVLLIFMKVLAIDPLAARAEKFGEKLVIFEPFIAVGNSGALAMFIPLVFLILLSDYPKLHGNALFGISRTGKRNWLCGQILFILFAIITFMSVVLAASILFSGGRFANDWSDAVTKYAARFPEEAYNFDSQLLQSNLYNQIPMITAVIQTFVLMSAYLLTLSLMLYLFKILTNRSGLAAAVAVIAAGVATTSLYSELRWAFPMANTMVWLHYTEILSEPIYPLWSSFIYFVGVIAILTAANFFSLKRLKFTERVEI